MRGRGWRVGGTAGGAVPSGAALSAEASGERGALGRQGSGPGKATGRAVCSPGQRPWALGEGCCTRLIPQGIAFLRTDADRCPTCYHAHVWLVIF